MLRTIPRSRPLARGLLSFVSSALETHSRGNTLGTVSAESCYSIFLRHVCLLRQAGATAMPRTVAELGPGTSLGTGFVALLAGATKYYALDLIDFTDLELNLRIFDELVMLFRRRAPIPATGVHSRRFPDLDTYEFPDFLAIAPDTEFQQRAAAIRADIAARSGHFVQMAVPWTTTPVVPQQAIDWIFSQSVLEHIDELSKAYRALARFLKPSGYMSHLIDFGSHGATRDWNGHWALNERMWHVVRGRLPYLLNRLPYSEHRRLADDAGFVTVFEKKNKNFDGLLTEQFAPRFRNISDEDARLRMVLIISQLSAKAADLYEDEVAARSERALPAESAIEQAA